MIADVSWTILLTVVFHIIVYIDDKRWGGLGNHRYQVGFSADVRVGSPPLFQTSLPLDTG